MMVAIFSENRSIFADFAGQQLWQWTVDSGQLDNGNQIIDAVRVLTVDS